MHAYLDDAASTRVDPRVLDEMLPLLAGEWGNPSSLHARGRSAREAVERARERTARLVGAAPAEVVFTASGTEADNLAILGTAAALEGTPWHLVTSAIEHPAVLEPCRFLERRGVPVTWLPCGADGRVAPEALRAALRPETRLVSVMAANNVTGVLQPVRELAAICTERGVPFHTDAVQAAGKVPVDVLADGVSLLSLSAHKIHGPKGAAALVVRKGTSLAPLLLGGGQEGGLRPSTENVAAIAGLGKAAELAALEMRDEAVRQVALREALIAGVLAGVPGASLLGDRWRRLPGHAAFLFEGLEGAAPALLLALDEASVAVSTGSACSARHADRPSHVLEAMGFDPVRARGALRVSMGRFTTRLDVERLLTALSEAAARLRAGAGLARPLIR